MELGGAALWWSVPGEDVAVVGIAAPSGACAGSPRKPWLCAAGSDTAGAVSSAAVEGIIPGSLTLCPEVGLIPSMTLEVTSPP